MDPNQAPQQDQAQPLQMAQAQGNPSMQNLLGMIMQREQERPTAQAQQQALQQYMEAVRNTAPLDTDTWSSAWRGALGSPRADLEGMAAAAGKEIVDRNELARKDAYMRDVLASKLNYEDVQESRKNISGMGAGATTAIMQNLLNPGVNVQGVGRVDKMTGKLLVPVSVQPLYDKLWEENFKAAREPGRNVSDPNAWATEQTNKYFQNIGDNPNIVGGRTTEAVLGMQPAKSAVPTPGADQNPPEEAAIQAKITQLNSDSRKYKDNPTIMRSITSEMDKQAIELAKLRKGKINLEVPVEGAAKEVPYGADQATPGAMPTPPAAVSPLSAAVPQPGVAPKPLPLVNPQVEAEKKSFGETSGKHMADTAVDIQKTGAAAQSLIGDLNMLEKLYTQHGENVPEGIGAPIISNMKSGLKSLGVEVQGQGATDVINALATKQALKSRTADGENLLPGAMSNYEDRLLQSTAPGLSQTHEGRLVLIQVIKAQMQMRTDLAAGARQYIKDHSRLDQGWFDVAAEIAKKNPFLDPKRMDALEAYGQHLAQKSKGVK